MTKPLLFAILSILYLLVAKVIRCIQILCTGAKIPIGLYISIAVSTIVLVGIIKGNRLAWQWARLTSLLCALISTVSLDLIWIHKVQPGNLYLLLWLVQLLALYMIVFSLGARGSRAHFKLICPSCGSTRVKARDLLFHKAACRTCGGEW